MMKAVRMPSLRGLVLIALAALSSCKAGMSLTEAEHLARAQEFRSQGNMQSAIIEAKNAIQKNQKSGAARLLLGEIYAEQGSGPEAEKELLKAEEFGVSMEAIKAPLARAYLAQNKFERVLREIEPGPQSSDINAAKILDARARAQRGMRKDDEACALFAEALKRSAKYVEAYWGLAWCAFTKDKVDDARSLLMQAIKLDDKLAGTWALLGDLERSQKRATESQAAYDKAIALRPEHTKARLGRATLQITAKKFSEASKDIDAVLARDKEDADALHLRGVALYHQGKYADAKTALELALRQAPESTATLLWLGLTNYASGNLEIASQHLQRFVRAVPTATDIKALLAYVEAKRGSQAEAKEVLASLQGAQFTDLQSLTALGQAFMLVGDVEASAKYFSAVVEQAPGSAAQRVNLASSLIRGGKDELALTELQKAIDLDPESKQAEQMLVLTLLKQKKFEEALRALEQAVSKHPKEAWPQNYKGAALFEKRDASGAVSAYKRALEIEPGNAVATHSLARIALEAGKSEEARQWYRQTLEKNPDHWQTMLAMADLEYRARRNDEAQQLLERAAQKHPTEPAVAVSLGRMHLGNNEARKALTATDAASKAAPAHPELLQLRGAAYLALGDAGNASAAYEQLARVAPSADAHYRQATVHAVSRDRKAMRAALGRALALDAAHKPSLAALARLDLSEGRVAEAQRTIELLGKSDPQSAEFPLLEAEAAAKAGDSNKALAALDRAAGRANAAAETRFVIAQRLLELGQAEKALALARQLAQAQPNRAELLNLVGAAELAAGRKADAIRTFEKVVQLLPKAVAPLLQVAEAKKTAGDFKGAGQAYEHALTLKADQPEVKALLAETRFKLGDAEAALKLAQELQRESPKLPLGHSLEGDILAAQQRSAEALAKYETAFSLRPEGALAMKIYEARAQGKPNAGAARELQRWVREHPKDAAAALYLGGVYLAVGEHTRAAEQYRQVLKSDAQNPAAINNLAWALHGAGQNKEALGYAEQAYRVASQSPIVMDTYGFFLVENGKLAQGTELLRKAAAAAPDQQDIHYHLGAALAKAGDKAAARAALEKALTLGAEPKAKAQIKALLESL